MLKVNLKFIVLMMIVFLLEYILGGVLINSVLYTFMIAFMIGLLSILLHRQKISISVKLNKSVYNVGESDIITMTIFNNSLIPMPYLCLKNITLQEVDTKYNGDLISINVKERKKIVHRTNFVCRGVYKFGNINVNMKDLFCIFEFSKFYNAELNVKVYPKIYNIEEQIIKESDVLRNISRRNNGMEDLYSTLDMREYREGDSLKRINWRVSAKYNLLYVRECSVSVGEEFTIFLDMNKADYELNLKYELEEALVNICSSLVNYMVIKEIKTKVFINALKPKVLDIKSKVDFHELMEHFLYHFSDGNYSFPKYIKSNINSIARLGSVSIIAGTINGELTKTLVELRERGNKVVVFYTHCLAEERDSIAHLFSMGVEFINLINMLNGYDTSKVG